MRILLVLGTSAGGVGRHVHGLVTGLAGRATHVVVACPHAGRGAVRLRRRPARAGCPCRVSRPPTPAARPAGRGDLGELAAPRRRRARPRPAGGRPGRAGRRPARTCRSSSPCTTPRPPVGSPARLYAGAGAGGGPARHRGARGLARTSWTGCARLGARRAGLAVVPGPPPPTGRPSTPSAVRADARRRRDGTPLARRRRPARPAEGPRTCCSTRWRARAAMSRSTVVVAGDGPPAGASSQRPDRRPSTCRCGSSATAADVPTCCAAADVVVSQRGVGGPAASTSRRRCTPARRSSPPTSAARAAVVGDAALLVPAGDAEALARGIRTSWSRTGDATTAAAGRWRRRACRPRPLPTRRPMRSAAARRGLPEHRSGGATRGEPWRAGGRPDDVELKPVVPTTKHIFVTGGVASSLGKGLTASSLGHLLRARGLRVTMQKLDPYLNVDPGTMNPFQHGEVFVTDDGAETDLDIGHYERFLDVNLDGSGQRHDRAGLQPGHRQGAARRVPRRHRPGHPAHHQRDQGADARRGRRLARAPATPTRPT